MLKVERLIQNLKVLDTNIIAEAVRQPSLFMKAADYRVSKMRARASIGARLDYERAHTATKFRNAKYSGDEDAKKLTEASIKERVDASPVIRRLREKNDRAYEREELSKLLVEAYRQRNSAIKIVAEIQGFEGSSAVGELERRQQRRVLVNKARRLLQGVKH